VKGDAHFSDDGQYRWWLSRTWSGEPPLVFAMLNPSTGTALRTDATLRRCIGYARRERAGGIVVVNLYALCATQPRGLLLAEDPEGDENETTWEAMEALHRERSRLVVAWGAFSERLVASRAAFACADWLMESFCLGVVQNGAPRHPLYVRADEPLVPWIDP
jgi:hypothetical protein